MTNDILDVDLNCPACRSEDSIHVSVRFQSTTTCQRCGRTFKMDWDEDAGGNVYGLPITDE